MYNLTVKKKKINTCVSDLSLHINEPIRACYQNEKRCDSEVKKLVVESENLAKLASDWQTKLADFDSALRDLGDVAAYAYAIERETCTVLNATKRILAKKSETDPT